MYAWEKNNVRVGKNVSPEAITYPTKVSVALETITIYSGGLAKPFPRGFPWPSPQPNVVPSPAHGSFPTLRPEAACMQVLEQ